MKLKEWLHIDAKDFKADYLLCIDQYIEYEIDLELKEIARLRYYEKKTRQGIAKDLRKKETEVSEKLEKIRNYLSIALMNKGWVA